MLTRAVFELAPSGYWSAVLLVELSSPQGLKARAGFELASSPCGLDSSTSRTADRYPEGASSNTARVNIFQSTSAVSGYHEKISVQVNI